MEIGLVEKVNIDEEMQQAYLDYAMSVIVARALPDARDGLKPVHRRILYAMYDMGLRPDTPYKKSARIVGEVLGKYHPHGDMAVYEAMARMAQDFSMRAILVDGQGNFGSMDGDSPAAMRYTEARLAPPALDMLTDINKNTVNFSPNFDGTLTEPDVLPAALPNLLINGATGIAVGMSTSIPPHNMGEVIDALRYMLENWNKLDDITVEDLMQFIQGPDFPTGGVIIQDTNGEALTVAYGSGRGRVTVQARARLEEMERGRSRIIVTELPYMTNKSSLIERIAELVREERLEGISDLRDESDRQGMRIVIELNKSADPDKVLHNLMKYTPMQSTFSIIMLALVDGEPRLLSLKQALRVYLDHRLEIVRRRSEFDLERARQRAHILEGLLVALKNLDEVIEMIRRAPDADTARQRLMKRFKLTEIQAQAILDLQLRRLASLERKKIDQEYKEVTALIKELEALLRSPAKMRQVISGELQAVKEAYSDGRRTQIVHRKEGETRLSMLALTDLTPDKRVWVSVTTGGLISRTREDRLPQMDTAPSWLVRSNTRDTLYLVDEQGEAAAIPVHSLPERENPAEGVPLFKASALRESDRLAAVFSLPPKGERAEDWFVLTVTRQGMVKKSAQNELPGPSASKFTLVKVNEGDRLGWLRLSNGQKEVFLATAEGMAIRFSEEEARPMGLAAAGVMGIKLRPGDEVVSMELLPRSGDAFFLASNGSARRVKTQEFPKQGRYGQGVQAWKLPAKTRLAGMAVGKGAGMAIAHLDDGTSRVIHLDAAPLQSRASARGKALAELKGREVLGLTVPWSVPRAVSGGVEEDEEPWGGTAGGQGGRRSAEGQLPGAGGRTPPIADSMDGHGVDGRPARRKSASAKTAAAKSTTAKSAAAKTAAAKTAAAKSGAGKAAAVKTTSAKSAAGKASAAKAAAAKTAAAKTAAAKTTSAKSASAKPAAGKASAAKAAAAKTASAKSASAKPSTGKAAAAKPGTAKAAAAKSTSTKSASAKSSTVNAASTKAAAAKASPAKTTSAKAAAAKAAATKTSAAKTAVTRDTQAKPAKPSGGKAAASKPASKKTGAAKSTPAKTAPAKPASVKKTGSGAKSSAAEGSSAAGKTASGKASSGKTAGR